MLQITPNLSLPEQEIDLQAIRAQGSGGQNVNKVASAIHLRFDIRASSLPDRYKERLLALSDQRITADGVVVIKAQQFRTQEMNKENLVEITRPGCWINIIPVGGMVLVPEAGSGCSCEYSIHASMGFLPRKN